MSSQSLIEQEVIKKFTRASIKQIVDRFSLACSYLNKAKEMYKTTRKKDQNHNVMVYTNLYDSMRLACEAFLLLKKCKAAMKDHHKKVIIATKALINDTTLNNVFIRFDKMRISRNSIDYGVDVRDLSNQAVAQAVEDANRLFKAIGLQIEKKDPQTKFKF